MAKVIDKDLGWNKILEESKRMKGSSVKVGVLSDAGQYPSPEGGANLADVATFNEFGTSRIPSRPFMRQAFDRNQPPIKAFTEGAKSMIFSGKWDVRKALEALGVFFVGKVKEIFVTGEFAENQPGTVRAKGSSRPLIDTGRLRNSIDYEVEVKG